MTEYTDTGKRYFLAVDGFRLLASMNIVLFHLQGIGGLWDLREKPQWLFWILKGPAFHATAFFLLGGFIFTIKFADSAGTFSTWSFVKKRFSELYPLHFITTLVMGGLKIAYGLHHGGVPIIKLGLSLFMHCTFLWSIFPFGTYALNRPSWALGAFFFCYVCFGITLKLVVRLDKKRSCLLLMCCCLLPIIGWTFLYNSLGMPDYLYHFFHTFAPIRFFEFCMGMLLARLFQLSKGSKNNHVVSGILNDLMILGVVVLIIINLRSRQSADAFFVYFSYHVLMVPLYFIILFGLARESGFIAKILSLPVVRKTGRSSFYPYLIHIPLISVITFILEHYFNYYKFLHKPLNICLFLLVLYGGSYVYVNILRKRKPSGPPQGR